MSETLRDRIKRHEGLRLEPYQDSLGNWTIGYGCRLPLTDTEIEAIFELRYDAADDALDRILNDGVGLLGLARDGVVLEMCYQLGERGVRRFERMMAALCEHNYAKAADEMLDSAWARETPERAQELAAIMRTGVAP